MNKRAENMITGVYYIGLAQVDLYLPNLAYECACTIGKHNSPDEDHTFEYYRALLHRAWCAGYDKTPLNEFLQTVATEE